MSRSIMLLATVAALVRPAGAAAQETWAQAAYDAAAPQLRDGLTRTLGEAIPFVSIEPAFRAALDLPDWEMLLLPGDRIVYVGDYRRALEDYQRRLAEYGHSLTDASGAVKLAETVLPEALLGSQGQAVRDTLRALDPTYMPDALTPDAVVAAARAAALDAGTATLRRLYDQTLSPEDYAGLPAPDFAPIPVPSVKPRTDLKTKTYKDWRVAYGDRDTLQATAAAFFRLSGGPEAVQAEAEANATLSVFGTAPLRVLDARGLVLAPKRGDSSLQGSIWVAGKTLLDASDVVAQPTLSVERSYEGPIIDVQNKVRFSVGPVPMSAVIGAVGKAGFSFRFEGAPLHASAVLEPVLAANGFAEVGADVEVARAGVGGRLSLIDANARLVATSEATFDEHGEVGLTTAVTSGATLTLLRGNLYGFVELSKPWPGYVDRWERSIYAWDGVDRVFGNAVNFRKVTTPASVTVAGDADEEDYAAADLDRYERDLADAIFAELNASAPRVDDGAKRALTSLRVLQDDVITPFWEGFGNL